MGSWRPLWALRYISTRNLQLQTFRSNRLELSSPYSPNECAARLAAAIDAEPRWFSSWSAMFGSKPVIGTVSGDSLCLRKRIGYRNSFQSSLTATMRPGQGGTVISGEMGMDPLVLAFLFIWFGLVILIGGSVFLATVGDILSGHRNSIAGAAIPVGMAGAGFAMVQLGRFLARGEARFLTEFLIQTLDARDQNDAV
jgi:hypothetical protein